MVCDSGDAEGKERIVVFCQHKKCAALHKTHFSSTCEWTGQCECWFSPAAPLLMSGHTQGQLSWRGALSFTAWLDYRKRQQRIDLKPFCQRGPLFWEPHFLLVQLYALTISYVHTVSTCCSFDSTLEHFAQMIQSLKLWNELAKNTFTPM